MPLRARRDRNPPAEIVPPVDGAECRLEVEALPEDQTLIAHAQYRVCLASARQIPRTLREIGRLREISFRQCGEGTGNAIDLDLFDSHYRHLFLWNCEKNEIAGAYRVVGTDEVIPRYGVHGLYTSTLFRFRRDFFRCVDPALELGRSFIQPEYQKLFATPAYVAGHLPVRRPKPALLDSVRSCEHQQHLQPGLASANGFVL
jgi:hypothetical protein